MDSRVLSTTHLVANTASLPYRAAKMAAVDPAGIPVMITATPVATGSSPRAREIPQAAAGSSTRRRALIHNVVGLTMVSRGTSTRMVPMINMVMAVLQLPMPVMVEVSRVGRGMCRSMIAMPMYTATRQGWVRMLRTTFFLSVPPATK